jgi:RNA recognition motif-containing protein
LYPGRATGPDTSLYLAFSSRLLHTLSSDYTHHRYKPVSGFLKGVLAMKIYVGNLSLDVTEDEIRQEFTAFGKVESVAVPTDRYSGKPRGFAFVEMPAVAEGQAAIAGLNGKTIKERTLTVNAARPRDDRGGGRRGGGYGGGGYGGGGYGGGGYGGGGRGRR